MGRERVGGARHLFAKPRRGGRDLEALRLASGGRGRHEVALRDRERVRSGAGLGVVGAVLGPVVVGVGLQLASVERGSEVRELAGQRLFPSPHRGVGRVEPGSAR